MDSSIKSVVSMLASDKKTTLFTATGEIIDMIVDGPYDTAAIAEFLTPKLTGMEAVEINLSEFTATAPPVMLEDFAKAGILMSHIIDGKTVQGIFYPTISAVEVTVGPDKVIIPHVDNLKAHMVRAAQDGSPSVLNFFKRLAVVIKERKHSGEDLMKFIKRSEMPLTNTGRIIAYKRVTSCSDEGFEDYFVDTHSKKIRQRVGSRVTMPVDMVDPSRHNSCSTGLHVANLGYLRGFSGDKTIIVLVDPENFIAVPHGEDTKARVCSYDIIGVMDANQHSTVCQGSSVKDDVTFEQLIISAVEGNTILPTEEVFVGNKEITHTNLLTLLPETDLPMSKKPTTGKALDTVAETETKTKEISKNVLQKTRDIKNMNADIPVDVVKAFSKLLQGVTKADVAKYFATSTRSIGRWMEKHNFEDFQSKSKKLVDVIITDIGDSKIHVIKGIRQVTECGLKEAIQLVEGDGRIMSSVPQTEAENMLKTLSGYGATVSIVRVGTPIPPKAKEVPEITNNLALPKVKTTLTLVEQASKMFEAGQYENLRKFKKEKKKSWDALGFTKAQEKIILE